MFVMLEMINASEAREDDENFKNAVDLMFDELAQREPDHFAVRQYAKYKLAAGKTAKSILISCGARLAPFDIRELRNLMSYDELELDTLGDKKTVLFLIMSDTDATFNFLISMVYTQMFLQCVGQCRHEYNAPCSTARGAHLFPSAGAKTFVEQPSDFLFRPLVHFDVLAGVFSAIGPPCVDSCNSFVGCVSHCLKRYVSHSVAGFAAIIDIKCHSA